MSETSLSVEKALFNNKMECKNVASLHSIFHVNLFFVSQNGTRYALAYQNKLPPLSTIAEIVPNLDVGTIRCARAVYIKSFIAIGID